MQMCSEGRTRVIVPVKAQVLKIRVRKNDGSAIENEVILNVSPNHRQTLGLSVFNPENTDIVQIGIGELSLFKPGDHRLFPKGVLGFMPIFITIQEEGEFVVETFYTE